MNRADSASEYVPSSVPFVAYSQHQTIRPSNLLTIPHDLLIEIIARMDWQDIMRLRETCHVLHDASKLRAVWLRLYAKARSSRIGQPRLETPIELWSDDVLERRTLRLLTSEMGWERRRGVPGSHRFLPRKRRDDFYLIEGGRWLLVAKQTGSVLYYDLDEAIPKERVLISDQFDDCHPSITSDVDNEGPFRLALHLLWYPSGTDPEAGQSLIQIWQVSLEVDTSDYSVRLDATMLTRLHRTGQYMQTSLSLCGNLISFTVDHDFLPASEPCVVVLDWTSTGGSNILSWTPLWQSPVDDVYDHSLAPGGMIVIVYSQHLQVFDVFDKHRKPFHLPVEMTSDILSLNSISRPFLSRETNTIRFIINADSAVYGLELQLDIRSDQSGAPQNFELVQYAESINGNMFHGYHYSVAHFNSSELVLVYHPWPGSEQRRSSTTGLQRKAMGLDGYLRTFRPFIDEHSGRIVLTPTEGYLCVLDYALI